MRSCACRAVGRAVAHGSSPGAAPSPAPPASSTPARAGSRPAAHRSRWVQAVDRDAGAVQGVASQPEGDHAGSPRPPPCSPSASRCGLLASCASCFVSFAAFALRGPKRPRSSPALFAAWITGGRSPSRSQRGQQVVELRQLRGRVVRLPLRLAVRRREMREEALHLDAGQRAATPARNPAPRRGRSPAAPCPCPPSRGRARDAPAPCAAREKAAAVSRSKMVAVRLWRSTSRACQAGE